MNITADSGLIQYLTIIHCSINITKNKTIIFGPETPLKSI